MNAQMKKGLIEMCILHYLSKKDLYGYDVMKLMQKDFPDVATSTFYSILRRLHKERALFSYVSESPDGPQRKYYTITDVGVELLVNSVKDWENIRDSVDNILSVQQF